MKATKFILIFILALAVFSCKKDEIDCVGDRIIETQSLENIYACENTQNNMDVNLSSEYMIIRNQEDFDELVSGDCLPEINFSLFDLVIGKKGLTNGCMLIDYKLIENCESANQNLIVTFHLDDTEIAPVVLYHALVPKLVAGQLLNVETVVLHD